MTVLEKVATGVIHLIQSIVSKTVKKSNIQSVKKILLKDIQHLMLKMETAGQLPIHILLKKQK